MAYSLAPHIALIAAPAAGSDDRTVKLWDLRSNDRGPIQSLTEARDGVTGVVITQETILTSSVDGCVRTYDVRKGSLLVVELPEAVGGLALSGDRQCVVCSCLDDTVRLIEASTGKLLNECVRRALA